MQEGAWLTIAAGIGTMGTVIGGYWATHTQGKRIEDKADTAAVKADTAAVMAEKAHTNTENISNGFAHHTSNGIDLLLEGQARQDKRIEQLFEAHGRTVKRLDKLVNRLDRHINRSRGIFHRREKG